MKTFGSGQTNGLPLLLTAITFAARQTLHTAPAGSATPNIVRVRAFNDDAVTPHTVTIAIEDALGAVLTSVTAVVPVSAGAYDVLGESGTPLILNGACTLKVYADAASLVRVVAEVDDQADVAGIASQVIASGLVAAVQNASRFAVGAQGGTGQATEANANIIMPRAGTLRNLRATASAAVGGGATVTVAVRVNGASSALSLTLANADGTAVKSDTVDSVAVAVGDLVTFSVATDNAGAPAANIHAAVELF
jgi:hypothetical protein